MRPANIVARRVDAQPAQVLRHRAAIVPMKLPRQMDRMHSHRRGERFKAKPLRGTLVMQNGPRFAQPFRSQMVDRAEGPADLRQETKDATLDCQRRKVVHVAEFLINVTDRQRGSRTMAGVQLSRRLQNSRYARILFKPRSLELHMKAPETERADRLGVHFLGWVQRQGVPL